MGKRIQIWAVVSGVLMVIGGIGPWVTVYGTSVNGTHGDGWIVVGAAVIGVGLCYVLRRNRWAGAVTIVAGVIALATTSYDRSHLERAINQAGGLAQAVMHVGWGLNLALVASFSLLLAGIVGVIRGPGTAVAPSPAPAASEPVPSDAPADPATEQS